jgi:hypothetical protein
MEEKVKRKNKGCLGCLIAVVIIVLLIVGGTYAWYLRGTYRIGKAEQFVSSYLNSKYHEEFVVSNGKYIWATGNYTFDACPKDDPEFSFPVFITGFYKSGIGDMYKNVWMARATHKMLDPFVNAISKNNYYGAMYGSMISLPKKEERDIELDIRNNSLTPLQAVAKYPSKIYLNVGINYAFDITKQNKDEVFKKVYKLIEFLRAKKIGKIHIAINIFPTNSKSGGNIINHTFRTSRPGWTKGIAYSIGFDSDDTINIKKWEDIGDYLKEWNSKNRKWGKVSNINNKNQDREIVK